MGFRTGAWAKVWEVNTVSDRFTKCRISVSHKDKETGQYITEFSGYAGFCGTAASSKASRLKEGDSIKLGDVDTQTYYDKEKQITYYNFNVYSFETNEDLGNPPMGGVNTNTAGQPGIPGDWLEEGLTSDDDELLPF